jgi:WD40 repeat protein
LAIYRIKEPAGQNKAYSFSLALKSQVFTGKFDWFRDDVRKPAICGMDFLPRFELNPHILVADKCDVKLLEIHLVSTPFWKPIVEDAIIPMVAKTVETYNVTLKATFTENRFSNLNSVVSLSDQCSFAAVDGTSAKIWDVQSPKRRPFVLIENEDDEITSSGINPISPSMLVFNMGCGTVRLFDIGSNTVISEMNVMNFSNPLHGDVAVISSDFECSGTLLAVRNFSHLQIWDIRATDMPVSVQEVQSYPERANYDRRNEDTKHDTFGSFFVKGGDRVFSGLFGQWFVCWHWKQSMIIKHRASRGLVRRKESRGIDATRRVSKIAGNHRGDILAVASTNALFFYELG